MARIEADPSERLKLLRAVRKVAKKDDVLNADEMAKVVKMTWRFLKQLIDADPAFPIVKRGAEGMSWVFNVRDTIDHLIRHYEGKLSARDEAQRRIARLAGITVPEDGSSGLSPRDFVEINRVQMDVQRRKVEQRHLVPADEVRTIMTGMAGIVQGEVTTMVSRNDPAGRWPPEARALINEDLRNMLVRIHDKFGEWLDDDVRGTGGAGSRSRTAQRRAVLPKRKGDSARA